jgi:dihydrofolate reductase
MRKVTLGLANSLDNYIARKDGGSDWLYWDQQVARITARFMKTIDAILIGRKTYEVMLGFGQAHYPGATNYVFSRTLKEAADQRVVIVASDAVKFTKALKRKKGKGICLFGGGELAQSLFNADLIDEVVLNIHPVLLGSGVPLFHEMNRQIDLELLDLKRNKRGNLIVSYRVKHARPKQRRN